MNNNDNSNKNFNSNVSISKSLGTVSDVEVDRDDLLSQVGVISNRNNANNINPQPVNQNNPAQPQGGRNDTE